MARERRRGREEVHRYRDDKEIEALHGLYEPKDDDGECGYHDDGWEDKEDKEWVN